MSSIRSIASRVGSKRIATSLQFSRFQSTTATVEPTAEATNVESPKDAAAAPQLETPDLDVPDVSFTETRPGSILERISEMTKGEFEQMLNSAPKPTLNRDKIVLEKFKELLQTYMSEDKLKKEISESSTLLSHFPNLIPTHRSEPYSEAELAIRQKYHALSTGKLGSNVVKVYKPNQLITNPPRPNQLTVSKLIASGAHLGHSTKLWNHATQPFIYGEYNGIHIIDLDITINYLKRAAKIVEGVAENGGLILYLGLKEGQLRAVKEAARRCNGYYVTHKWVPGTITNSLENPKPRRELDMGDIATGKVLGKDELTTVIKPDLIVVLNPLESKVALKEALQASIPTIGLVDTNCNPSLVTYPIPANDDSNRATNLICGVLGKAGEIGYQRRLAKVAEYKTALGLDPNSKFDHNKTENSMEEAEQNDVYDEGDQFNEYEDQGAQFEGGEEAETSDSYLLEQFKSSKIDGEEIDLNQLSQKK